MSGPQCWDSHADPGLQPERTELAWGRTSLSILAAGAVFVRWMTMHGLLVGIPVVVSVLLATMVGITRKHRFHQAVRGVHIERLQPNIGTVAATAATAVVLSLLGIFIVLFVPSEPR